MHLLYSNLMCVYIHTHTYINMYIFIQTYAHAHSLCLYACVHTYTRTSTHTYPHTYMHRYIYIWYDILYIYTYTDIHTHARKLTLRVCVCARVRYSAMHILKASGEHAGGLSKARRPQTAQSTKSLVRRVNHQSQKTRKPKRKGFRVSELVVVRALVLKALGLSFQDVLCFWNVAV